MTRTNRHSISHSHGDKRTIISAMGLWGHGDQLAVEITAQEGTRELRRSILISLTDEQMASIENLIQTTWDDFEEEAIDLRDYLEKGDD